MNTAQKDLIASEICGMTTLCATVIAPLKYNNSSGTLLFSQSSLYKRSRDCFVWQQNLRSVILARSWLRDCWDPG